MSIRIVTDSTSDLPSDLAEELGITVVPASVFFGDEHLLDGVDIDSDTFFERLARESQLPTTSQPSPGAFRDTYQRLKDEGATEILSLHISEKLSGTLASARQGAQQVDGVRIEAVDSRCVTLSLGMGAMTAARGVADGASLDEALDLVTGPVRALARLHPRRHPRVPASRRPDRAGAGDDRRPDALQAAAVYPGRRDRPDWPRAHEEEGRRRGGAAGGCARLHRADSRCSTRRPRTNPRTSPADLARSRRARRCSRVRSGPRSACTSVPGLLAVVAVRSPDAASA